MVRHVSLGRPSGPDLILEEALQFWAGNSSPEMYIRSGRARPWMDLAGISHTNQYQVNTYSHQPLPSQFCPPSHSSPCLTTTM